jgi:hypothetical protein
MEEMSCQYLSGVSKIAIVLPDFSLIKRQYVELGISIGSDYRRGSCDVENLFVIICEKEAAETFSILIWRIQFTEDQTAPVLLVRVRLTHSLAKFYFNIILLFVYLHDSTYLQNVVGFKYQVT